MKMDCNVMVVHKIDARFVSSTSINYPLINFDLDIDECFERIDKCQQECVNSNGSYACACRTGYRLTLDGYNCTGNAARY